MPPNFITTVPARGSRSRTQGDVVTQEATYQAIPEVSADEREPRAGTVVMKFGGTSVSATRRG